jgi:hypothetical protein
MPKTRDDLVNRALKNLGALPAGQTANQEEYDQVDELVEPTMEQLAARDIFHVPDLSAIDDAAFLWLAICLAWSASPEFGNADIVMPLDYAEAQLKVIQSEVPTYKPLEIIPW